MLTTNHFLATGGIEGNPVMAAVQASLGSWWPFSKLAIVLVCTPILALGKTRYAALLVALYSVVVINNVML